MGVWSSKVVARFCSEPSIVAKSGEGKKSAGSRRLTAGRPEYQVRESKATTERYF
jgi:hypothetical protein